MIEIGSTRVEYTIGRLSSLYDLSLRTLRFYEDFELLCPRKEGTKRFYSENDRTRLEIIVLGKRLRFSLATIRELIKSRAGLDATGAKAISIDTLGLKESEIRDQITLLKTERACVDNAIDELRVAASRLVDQSERQGSMR